MAILSLSTLLTNLNATLSDNRIPTTRGSELNVFLRDFIDTVFQHKIVYHTTIQSVGDITILPTTHLLPFITGVRIEDLSGNQIFIPNKIDDVANSITIFSDTNISYKLKIF